MHANRSVRCAVASNRAQHRPTSLVAAGERRDRVDVEVADWAGADGAAIVEKEAYVTGVTNRIVFDEAADMVGRCRACVSFAVDGRPRVEAAIVRYEQRRFVVGLDATCSPPPVGAEVVVVVDEGVQFFDLRAIHARGTAGAVHVGPGDDLAWFEVEPTKVTCWDYGRLRFEGGDQEDEQR